MKIAISTLVARNREAMRLFKTCINTNDLELGRTLIAETAAFKTPVSPTPLYGAEGCLSVAPAFFVVMTTVVMAGLREIVEWPYAAIDGGERQRRMDYEWLRTAYRVCA